MNKAKEKDLKKGAKGGVKFAEETVSDKSESPATI